MMVFKKIHAYALSIVLVLFSSLTVFAADEVSVSHYFSGELGKAALTKIFDRYTAKTGITIKDGPIGHEDYKAGILVRAAGGNLPDIFSYWAGARTQFVVDAGNILPLDDAWKTYGLNDAIVKSVSDSATVYNGKRYLVPFNYHYAGMFYNKKVMEKAGITELPADWSSFKALLATLKAKNIAPIALGTKNRWPGQFWFDYLLLRTAGPEYRAKLMAGSASYTDNEVKTAMKLWKELVDAGYFTQNANADTWTDAADKVARGDAAMTLMGTWITGYWDGNDLKPGEDYDFFEFPEITKGVPNAVVGPVDGWLVSKNSDNVKAAMDLVSFLVSDAQTSGEWAKAFGAISPNVHVDPNEYTSVMQKAVKTIKNADTYAFNYDLATPPPVAEYGLAMFARFMDNASGYDKYLADVQKGVKDEFNK